MRQTALSASRFGERAARSPTRQLLFLELNEVNFEYVAHYCARGRLPNIATLLRQYGVACTHSETRYEHLEPWIQWVTAHTGRPFSDHGVLRLGDIVLKDIPQIWEQLEEQGLSVGAMSPMNAKNRTRAAAFFVPDPWTSTRLTGPLLLRRMHRAIRQAVNDNAQAKLSLDSAVWLLAGIARYARPANYLLYFQLAAAARRKPWARAMFLDLLFADVFIRQVSRSQPHFASLFLNAAAHIQHHYMFNSAAYTGERSNPAWYVSAGEDPIHEIYALYDRVVGQVQRACPGARLMIATGLHQDPHADVTFYWRLRDHEAYLRKLGVPFARVSTRMSRDFVIECAEEREALTAAEILTSASDPAGQRLFEVDNRGRDLFVMLVWPHDIDRDFVYTASGRAWNDLRDDVVFVAIKNGSHNGIGYFIDTGCDRESCEESFALSEIPSRICDAFGLSWQRPIAPHNQAAVGV